MREVPGSSPGLPIAPPSGDTVNLYDLVYAVLAGVTSPWWARKSRNDWRQRLGHIDPLAPKGQRPRVLIHAVSVGEVSALRSLIPLLTDDIEPIVAVTTDTGIARAHSLFGDTCPVVRYPLDFSRCVRRFLDAIEPDAAALVELEVWPNFMRQAKKRRIPVAVINGRLSDQSFRGYKKLRPVLKPVFGALTLAAVQDQTYRDRFVAMGVDPERCVVTGSMKWDAVDLDRSGDGPGAKALEIASSLGIDRSRPLIVAGSTADGEEALIHQACPDGVQLLCAPRHPERFDQALAAMPGCVRRTAPETGGSQSDRFLLDTIGELGAAYELADVVVLGRTFLPLRGSDPTEPIAMGKPVVLGPSVENFASIVGVLEEAGAIVRTDSAGLGAVLVRLISDAEERAEMARRGIACVREHQGVSARHAEMLVGLVLGKGRGNRS
jgi:3-deoxy-D-manno-octulosonic-acid transferase